MFENLETQNKIEVSWDEEELDEADFEKYEEFEELSIESHFVKR